MDTKHFTVVAGFQASAAHDYAVAAAAKEPGFDLPNWQVRHDNWVAAEIGETVYGYNLRYASGLNNWSVIRPAQSLGTLDKALAAAQAWVAEYPGVRYVFVRNSALAKAGEIAEKVAERKAAEADNARATRSYEHDQGWHATHAVRDGACEKCDALYAPRV